MASFPLTHIYGVTRSEYYRLTGTTPAELIGSLEAKVELLKAQRDNLRRIYRRKTFVSREGRYLASVLKHIATLIAEKEDKVKMIRKYDLR